MPSKSDNATCEVCGVRHIPGSKAQQKCMKQAGNSGSLHDESTFFPELIEDNDYDEDFTPEQKLLQSWGVDNEEIMDELIDKGFAENPDSSFNRKTVEQLMDSDSPSQNIDRVYSESEITGFMEGEYQPENFADEHLNDSLEVNNMFQLSDQMEIRDMTSCVSMYCNEYNGPSSVQAYTSINTYLRTGEGTMEEDRISSYLAVEDESVNDYQKMMQEMIDNGDISSDDADPQEVTERFYDSNFADENYIEYEQGTPASETASAFMPYYKIENGKVLKDENYVPISKNLEESGNSVHQFMADNIHSYIDKFESMNDKPKTLFRGATLDSEMVSQLEKDSTIELQGISSCSMNFGTAQDFSESGMSKYFLAVNTTKGAPIAHSNYQDGPGNNIPPTSSTHQNEHEVILKDKTQLKVSHVDYDNRIIYLND